MTSYFCSHWRPQPDPQRQSKQMKEEADYQPPTEKMRSVHDLIHSHPTTRQDQEPHGEDHTALIKTETST